MSPPVRVAVLDDYQQVAFRFADWSSIKDRLSIDVYTETITDEDELVDRLKDYEIICANRERTKIRASLIDRLPGLK
jgi:26S proteasome regulatory subunit N2